MPPPAQPARSTTTTKTNPLKLDGMIEKAMQTMRVLMLPHLPKDHPFTAVSSNPAQIRLSKALEKGLLEYCTATAQWCSMSFIHRTQNPLPSLSNDCQHYADLELQLDLLDLAFLHLLKRPIDLKTLLRTPKTTLHRAKVDPLAVDAHEYL